MNFCHQIVQHIPGIYTDLQKFAVAFEHLSNMEENSTVDDTKAFKKVVSYLAMVSGVLCYSQGLCALSGLNQSKDIKQLYVGTYTYTLVYLYKRKK